MTVATLKAASPPALKGVELVARFFDTALIITPPDNPVYTPPMLSDLLLGMQELGQLVPAWVCPMPDLLPEQRLCIDGNRRLAVARLLGLQFWAFDLDRFVPEEEWIELTFQHNHSRRLMSRDEIAQRGGRYMELKGCTAAEAAKLLKVSGPTLSRAFGERRIPPELRERAELVGPTIRSLIAAAPIEGMPHAIDFALTPGAADGKKPTRDQVDQFIRRLKNPGKPKTRPVKTVTLRVGGRVVTLTVDDKDSTSSVAKDLTTIATQLGKHTHVRPDGWTFLFP